MFVRAYDHQSVKEKNVLKLTEKPKKSYSNAISHFVFISDDESLPERTEIYELDFAKQRHIFQTEENARDMIFIKQIFTPFVLFDIAKAVKLFSYSVTKQLKMSRCCSGKVQFDSGGK